MVHANLVSLVMTHAVTSRVEEVLGCLHSLRVGRRFTFIQRRLLGGSMLDMLSNTSSIIVGLTSMSYEEAKYGMQQVKAA